MNQKYDFSQLIKQTRAIEVTLDRPRFMSYTLEAIEMFQRKFSMSVTAWLQQYTESDPPIRDMYYVAWLGFCTFDTEFTEEMFQALVTYPVLNALYKGPVLQALVGYGALEN
jgi:hypothetical protein